MCTVLNDQGIELDKIKFLNLKSITKKRNPTIDNEVSILKKTC